ncbi:rhodanese homology domain-containing protein [Ascidiimonas sp. W6]|uniref:rhodanese-like domain-containing protein n=1 Tax=Ascidiimonas meishanensis TaxID=3128903 RepID=UPI0030EEC58F
MHKKVFIFICCFSLFLVKTSSAQESLYFLLQKFNSKEIPYITVDSLQQNLDSFAILDAREPNEYQVSHLKDAIFVGFEYFSKEEIKKLVSNREKPIAIYCSIGIRSHKIAKKLKKMGYKHIFNVYGGIFEWKNKGYAVVDTANKETEKVHAYSRLWGVYLRKGEKIYD